MATDASNAVLTSVTPAMAALLEASSILFASATSDTSSNPIGPNNKPVAPEYQNASLFDKSEAWEYDSLNNRKTMTVDQDGSVTTFAYNSASGSYIAHPLNKITDINGTPVVYDDNGNMTDDGVNIYQWDIENRLKSVSVKSSGNKLVEYAYDALGRRISKFVYDKDSTETPQPVVSKTFYIWNGWQVVEERDADNVLLAEYVWGPGIDNLLAAKRLLVDANGSPLLDGGQRQYFWHYAVKNHIGSVVAWVDASGNVEERFRYDIFGKPYRVDVETGEVIPVADAFEAPSAISPYLFTCREYEPETAHAGEPGSGLYYYRARFYSPTQGRFISLDPLNYVDGMNIYAYVNNNPVIFIDPYGLNELPDPYIDQLNLQRHRMKDPLGAVGDEIINDVENDTNLLQEYIKALPPEVIAGIKDGRGNEALAAFAKEIWNEGLDDIYGLSAANFPTVDLLR